MDLHTACLLLLVAESLHRATGRRLTPTDDLLAVPPYLQSMHCALVVAERQPGSHGSSSTCHAVTFANTAAMDLLHPTLGAPLSAVFPDLQLRQAVETLAPGGQPRWKLLQGCQACCTSGHDSPGLETVTADVVAADVASPTGRVVGTALLFDAWRHSDGRLGRPFVEAVPADQLPQLSQLRAAQGAVRERADAVRRLKAAPGPVRPTGGTSSAAEHDEALQQAVRELKGAKAEAQHVALKLWAYNAGCLEEPDRADYPCPFGVMARLMDAPGQGT